MLRIDCAPTSGYPGITLRQLERADIDAWYAYLKLPQVFEHTSWNLSSPADLNAQFEGYASTSPESIRRMAVVDESAGALIGTIGFHSISDVNRTAEIAYDLCPSHWGRGIAHAICTSVTAWAFFQYGFLRVQATVLTSNARSARLLVACGYQYEGLLRSYRMVRGTPGDFALYSRLATD